MNQCCPSCERHFTKLEDYPRIHVVSVDSCDFPEFITDTGYMIQANYVPREVRTAIEGSPGSKMKHKGMIYRYGLFFTVHNDITEDVRKIMSSSDIEEYLELLKSGRGKEMRTENFLPQLNRGRYGFSVNEKYSLNFDEQDQADNNRCSELWLTEVREDSGSNILQLARIYYVGLLNPIDVSPK